MQYVTRGSKILIVESDRAVLEMIQIRLDVAGYHALAARSAQAAVEMMRNTRPSAMILELNLPDMSGLELLEIIKDAPGPPMPVLVMGRQLAPDAVRRAVSLGARDCVAKPFGGAEIIDRVGRLLKRLSSSPAAARPVTWVA
jgi:DNA-binding response OmpR family regulator